MFGVGKEDVKDRVLIVDQRSFDLCIKYWDTTLTSIIVVKCLFL